MTLKNDLAWVLRRRLLPKPLRKYRKLTAEGPVVVAGLFSTANGIGKTARLHYEALQAAGIDCLAIDLSAFFGVVDLPSSINFLEKIEKNTQGTLIVCLNPLEAEAALYSHKLRLANKWRIIGSWVWELPVVPKSWTKRSRYFSEIWVPSQFTHNALGAGLKCPVRIVPLCLPAEPLLNLNNFDRERDGLNFLIAADGWSSYYRKNVMGGLLAYKQAFPLPSKNSLLLKCRNLEKHSEFSNALLEEIGDRSDISILGETVSDTEMATIIGGCDVLISLHRSEGFGLVLAEAMHQEKVVIATAWSGNMDFMNANNSVPIEYELAPVDDPFGVYSFAQSDVWASAKIPEAALAIKRVAQNSLLRNELGKRARLDVLAILDQSKVALALR